jgi:hypothetical protein
MGRAYIKMVMGVCFRGNLILSFSLLFLWFCRFSCHLLVLRLLLLDDILQFFFGFWIFYLCFMCLRFEIQTLCFLLSMYSSRKRLRNEVISTIVWLWWVIDLSWFEFESMIFWIFYPIICSCGELCLLVSWCVGDRCNMASSDEDLGRSRRPGAEDRGWSSTSRVLGGWTIERSGDTMCGRHRAQRNEEHRFLGWASKPRSAGFSVWASKSAATVWWFESQNHRDGFLFWASKPSGLWFVSYATKSMGGGWHGTRVKDLVACFAWKQVGLGFLSLPQNWRRSDGGWCTWHHRRGHMKMKSKTDGSMRWTASDSPTLTLPFS